LTAGFSFGFGKYDDFDRQSIRLFGLDAAVKKGPFELKGEWARFVLDRGPAEIAAGAPPASNGWYVEGDWHFFPKCWRGRSCFLDAESLFTLAVRYDRIDTDESARGIDRATRGDAFLDDRQRITFGVNFRPLQRTVIKVEYQWLPELPGIAAAKNDRFVVSFATYF
jgi:hypothetical protein